MIKWIQNYYLKNQGIKNIIKNHLIVFGIVKILSILSKNIEKNHGRIIKWTQHIGFLTLAGMERVVEGNHGNDSKKG